MLIPRSSDLGSGLGVPVAHDPDVATGRNKPTGMWVCAYTRAIGRINQQYIKQVRIPISKSDKGVQQGGMGMGGRNLVEERKLME